MNGLMICSGRLQSLNRTIMELKYILYDMSDEYDMNFESHHNGIEMYVRGRPVDVVVTLNRTIMELKSAK